MEQTAARELAKKLNDENPGHIHVAMTRGQYMGRWSRWQSDYEWIVVDERTGKVLEPATD